MSSPYGHAEATPGFDASAGLLTAEEVAGLYRVEVRTVWVWARNDRIPRLRLPGGDWRFSRRWVFERLGLRVDG